MDHHQQQGKNKQIESTTPWPRSSNVASPFISFSPSIRLPPLPPRNVKRKPYAMALGAAGSSSSGGATMTLPFQDPNRPFPMRSGPCNNVNVDLTEQLRPSFRNLSLGTSSPSDVPVRSQPQVGNGAFQFRAQQQGRDVNLPMDPKLRRLVSNRNSAYKARMKKLMHTNGMEKDAENLKTLIAVYSSKIALESGNKNNLAEEQHQVHQMMDAVTKYTAKSDAEIEEHIASALILRQKKLAQRQQRLRQQMEAHGNWDQRLTATGKMMNPNPVDDGEERNLDLLIELYLKIKQKDLGQVLMPGWEAGQAHMPNVMDVASFGQGQKSNAMAGTSWEVGQRQNCPNVMVGASREVGQGYMPNAMAGAIWEALQAQQPNAMAGASWEAEQRQRQQPNVMANVGVEVGQGQLPNVMAGTGWEDRQGKLQKVMGGFVTEDEQGQAPNVMVGAGWEARQGPQPNVMVGDGWEVGQGPLQKVMAGGGWEDEQMLEQNMMVEADWEPGLVQETNVSIEQSEASQEQNLSQNEWKELLSQESLNLSMAELEEFLSTEQSEASQEQNLSQNEWQELLSDESLNLSMAELEEFMSSKPVDGNSLPI